MRKEAAVQVIWNYHLMNQPLEACDLIWALGSHDLRVADRVAELWHEGLAPLIVMSGGFGNFTEGIFEKAEAELFAGRAVELGVPEGVMVIENRSTNTGENVAFTREILQEKGIQVKCVIAVQKPYMERRTFATIAKQWEEIEVKVTSPQLNFHEYCGEKTSEEDVIHIMVGDLQRIMEYPKKGFMLKQEIPEEVKEAFDFLIEAGYRGHLMRG
ncbi:MAG: uncharacterized SAM-binding protein YcdF (DUF218 family) [Paracoccaceae bacterium]|jgi:uncharacterized SAM-binding protein YcdF (DUF218 family)